MRHWYFPGIMNLLLGKRNVFAFNFIDLPVNFILVKLFISKKENSAKSTPRSSFTTYTQPVMLVKPSVFAIADGAVINSGGVPEKLKSKYLKTEVKFLTCKKVKKATTGSSTSNVVQ